MTALGGKYRIGERIGGGGMAEVFRAELLGAEGFSRAVAIKRMKRSISADKEFAKLFIAEARLAAKLDHANVVQTLDFSRDEQGCFYLVMELIDGVDLRQLVQTGRVPMTACVFLISEILRALDYAHEMASDGQSVTIVHRDISPHNIMMSWQGAVKIVDFGIAKAIAGSLVSRSGSLKGKVAYMSPEQVHGHTLDGRTDLFAIGIVLHELLTGERLFVGESEAATLSKLLTQPIPLPSSLNDQVPPDLDRVVMKLLDRDRAQRYLRAHDALQDLLNGSVSAMRGRADLETVLAERFPSRAPRRVRRLSSSHEDSIYGSQTPAAEPMPSPPPAAVGLGAALSAAPVAGSESFANGATVPTEPKVLPPLSATLAAVPSALPKRTLTAPSVSGEEEIDSALIDSGSIATTPGVDEDSILPIASKRGHYLLAFGLAVLAGAGVLWLSTSSEPKAVNQLPAIALDASPALITLVANDSGPHANAAPTPSLDASAATGAPEEAGAEDPSLDEPVAIDGDDRGEDTIGERKALKNARLTVRVKPWATITIDGKSYGQTPQTIELGRGKHRIHLENGGLDRKERFSITLKAGQDKLIDKDWR